MIISCSCHVLFSFLAIFDVGMNNLEGSVPTELYHLSNLKELVLGGNPDLTGNINSDLGFFTSLETLSLGPSQFTGTLPQFLFDFVELTELTLAGAAFSGTLSEDFSRLDRLETLHLNNNTFTGSIPAAFDSMIELSEYFHLLDYLHCYIKNTCSHSPLTFRLQVR